MVMVVDVSSVWARNYAYQSARTFFSDVPIAFVLRKNEVVIPLYSRVARNERRGPSSPFLSLFQNSNQEPTYCCEST